MAEISRALEAPHMPALVVGGVGLLALTEAAQVYLGMSLLGQPVPWLTALRLTGVLDFNPELPLRLLGSHLQNQQKLWDARLAPLPIRAWAPGTRLS